MTNGKMLRGVPAQQIARFKCPNCQDEIFEMKQAVRLIYDRLDSQMDLHAAPALLMRCLGCGGFLRKIDGVWKCVDVPGTAGDDWKREPYA